MIWPLVRGVLLSLILLRTAFPTSAQAGGRGHIDPADLEAFLDAFGPLALLVRHRRKLPPVTPFVRRAYGLAVLPALLNVIFSLSLIKVFWTSRTTMTMLLVLPLVAAVLTVGVLVMAALMWWRMIGSVAGRIHYSLIALVTVLFVWFPHSWNFLGFRFG